MAVAQREAEREWRSRVDPALEAVEEHAREVEAGRAAVNAHIRAYAGAQGSNGTRAALLDLAGACLAWAVMLPEDDTPEWRRSRGRGPYAAGGRR